MTERLFFAVRPDAATALRIQGLALSLRAARQLRGRPLGPERFHVTLHLIGDFAGGVPPRVIEAALGAAQPVAEAMAPFPVGFDRVASFARKARNMPLVLLGGDAGVAGLAALQARLVAALAAAGLAPWPGHAKYTPHLTLLYDDRHVAALSVEPVVWLATELHLVRSLLGRSRHELAGRILLRG